MIDKTTFVKSRASRNSASRTKRESYMEECQTAFLYIVTIEKNFDSTYEDLSAHY